MVKMKLLVYREANITRIANYLAKKGLIFYIQLFGSQIFQKMLYSSISYED